MKGMRAPMAKRAGDSTVTMEPPIAMLARTPIPTTEIIIIVRPT